MFLCPERLRWGIKSSDDGERSPPILSTMRYEEQLASVEVVPGTFGRTSNEPARLRLLTPVDRSSVRAERPPRDSQAGHGRSLPCADKLDAKSTYTLSAREQSLVDAIRDGDSDGAAPLYDTLRPSIELSLRRALKDKPTDFEDLVQITFERVIRTIANDKFKGNSQLTTWAYSIASHVAVDWLRSTVDQKLRDAVDVHSLDELLSHRIPERQLEARSDMRRIQGILRRMKRLNAATLVLHDVYHYTMPEVARMLNMSVTAAESRLRRARQELLRRSTKRIPPVAAAEA